MVKWILGIVVVVALAAGCQKQQSTTQGIEVTAPTDLPARQQDQARSAVIWVKGLSCPLCVQAIKKELQAVKGVEAIDVNYQNEYATVTLSPRKPPTREQIVQAVEKSGYVLTKVEMK